MVLSCGLGNFNGALFHLFNHAFFKAALFLSAGCLIHYFRGEQDMRKMGFNPKLFFLMFSSIGANLALVGIFPLSGYYSKDFILETAGTLWL
jgi:NADH-quinone oxidoreductase subunit L